MEFNQINQNKGDVNTAFAEKGNVIQTVGHNADVKVEQPKENLLSMLWEKAKLLWKWLWG